MKTSSAKAKGKRCVKETKALLLQYAPHLKDDDIFIPTGSVPGVDVHFSPEARKVYDLAIECKNVQNLNIWKAYEQAQQQTGKGYSGEPIVFFKRNNTKLLVCLDAEYFTHLMTMAYDFKYGAENESKTT